MLRNKLIALFACAAALALAAGLAGCSGGSAESPEGDAGEAPAAEQPAAEPAADADADADADAGAAGATVTAAELASPDVTVAYGDFDAMSALSSDIQNGRMDGQVVEVDGIVTHFASGMSYNIGEASADGSETIGTMFVIDGFDYATEEDAYPADEAHVKITGKVGIDADGIYYLIYTLPEYVVAME